LSTPKPVEKKEEEAPVEGADDKPAEDVEMKDEGAADELADATSGMPDLVNKDN